MALDAQSKSAQFPIPAIKSSQRARAGLGKYFVAGDLNDRITKYNPIEIDNLFQGAAF